METSLIPLRDRDDLPDEVRQILSVRRHVANPWTEEDALVIMRFRGFEPSEPWPGDVGVAWRGVCALGHESAPHLSQVLAGRPPCSRSGHVREDLGERKTLRGLSVAERQEKMLARVHEIALRRGDEIVGIGVRAVPAGKKGTLRKSFLTIKYGCGHTTEELAMPASRYVTLDGVACGTCYPKKLIPGLNDLATVRPDLAAQLADPRQADSVTISTNRRVTWRCPDCHFEWAASVGQRHHLGSGCPECNGAGYSESAPGTLYVVQGTSVTTREVLIKVGISNVPKQRISMHAKQGLDRVLSTFTWSDGAVAPVVERRWVQGVRKAMPDYLKAKKTDLPDGYREAVIDTDESRLAVHGLLLEAEAAALETLTEKDFDPRAFLPRAW